MPDFADLASDTAPGKLRSVQTWSKADVTAEQINKYL